MQQYQYILVFGSNKGDRKSYIKKAFDLITNQKIKIIKETTIIKTAPSMEKNQGVFSNCAALVECNLQPAELMSRLTETELQVGRSKTHKFGPREIDIDIVWYSGGKYREQGLTIPHEYNNARPWVRDFIVQLVPDKFPESEYYKKMNVTPIQHPGDFLKKKEKKEKIVMITAYDYSVAKILSKTSIDTILVGDSLGNVIQGKENTISVTLEQMVYHCANVKRGFPDTFLTGDMPFLSYHVSAEDAVRNAGQLIQSGLCNAVKVEGGSEIIEMVRAIIRAKIPVMGHLGLTPQSILQLDGFKVQGKIPEDAQRIMDDAILLEKTGVFAIVLEMVPAALGKKIAELVKIPVIGIGAGPDTDGQVMVYHDALGYDPDFSPKFVRRYANMSDTVKNAMEEYAQDVRSGKYPDDSEYFR